MCNFYLYISLDYVEHDTENTKEKGINDIDDNENAPDTGTKSSKKPVRKYKKQKKGKLDDFYWIVIRRAFHTKFRIPDIVSVQWPD